MTEQAVNGLPKIDWSLRDKRHGILQSIFNRVRGNLMAAKQNVCPKGHRFTKSSDCPTCPICEAARKPADGFLARLAAPARRALEREGIATLQQLAKHTEAEILSLHGMGPNAVQKLKDALQEAGLRFQD